MPYWQIKLLKITMAGQEIWGFAPYPTWPSTVTSMALMAMKRKKAISSLRRRGKPFKNTAINYHTAIPIEASILFMAGRQV